MLAHPSFGVTKVYIAKVEGRVTAADDRDSSREGIDLEDGPIAADKARLLVELGATAAGRSSS